MGMDFDVRRLDCEWQAGEIIYKETELLYMRKPYHLANCCMMVANRDDLGTYGNYDISTFQPYPFTAEDLRKVLALALYYDRVCDSVEWDNEGGARKEEYIEKWIKLIEDTENGNGWAIIEWG